MNLLVFTQDTGAFVTEYKESKIKNDVTTIYLLGETVKIDDLKELMSLNIPFSMEHTYDMNKEIIEALYLGRSLESGIPLMCYATPEKNTQTLAKAFNIPLLSWDSEKPTVKASVKEKRPKKQIEKTVAKETVPETSSAFIANIADEQFVEPSVPTVHEDRPEKEKKLKKEKTTIDKAITPESPIPTINNHSNHFEDVSKDVTDAFIHDRVVGAIERTELFTVDKNGLLSNLDSIYDAIAKASDASIGLPMLLGFKFGKEVAEALSKELEVDFKVLKNKLRKDL